MLVGKLAEHLRYLISNSKKARDGERHRDQSYHSILEGSRSLTELANEVLSLPISRDGCGHRPAPSQLFSLQLLKRIILTQFELLCVSVELQNDVEYAFGEFRSLCEHTSHFNGRLLSVPQQSKYLEFADFADVAISTQTQVILNTFLYRPSIESIGTVAKFEQGFVSALVAMFATFTALLQPGGSQKMNMIFVSEEMFSIAQTSNLSWLDCLIPGAQSESLRLIVKELIAKLWSGVTSHLVAHLQPLTLGGEYAESILTLLKEALQHKGQLVYTSLLKQDVEDLFSI